MASSLHLGEFAPPMAVLSGYGFAYGTRVRTLRREGRPVELWRKTCFAAGIAIVGLTQVPPLDDLADHVLVAHMVQHLLIGDVASLLIVVGLSGPLLVPLLRQRWGRWLQPLTHPLVALGLWALDSYVWRLPLLYQAALRSDLLHALEHASYLWCGMLLWVALLGPLPKPRWFGNWAKLGYVAAVRLVGAVLANVFIWTQTVLYPYYDGRDSHAGLTPISDQNLAGGVMMVEQMVLTIGLLGWLFHRLAAQDEQRQQLLDLAAEHGRPLKAERAERAAAAGTASLLRERLTSPEGRQGHRDDDVGTGRAAAPSRDAPTTGD